MRPLTKTFTLRKDALERARLMEVEADRRDLPEDAKVLQTITLRDLVRRYRDEVTVLKKGRETETEFLNAFLRHTICARSISELAGLRGVSRRAAHEDTALIAEAAARSDL